MSLERLTELRCLKYLNSRCDLRERPRRYVEAVHVGGDVVG